MIYNVFNNHYDPLAVINMMKCWRGFFSLLIARSLPRNRHSIYIVLAACLGIHSWKHIYHFMAHHEFSFKNLSSRVQELLTL